MKEETVNCRGTRRRSRLHQAGGLALGSTLLAMAAGCSFSATGTAPTPDNSVATRSSAVGATRFSHVLASQPFLLNVHVPFDGAIAGTTAFIPFNRLEERASSLPPDRSTLVAVYCRSGRMSHEAVATLRSLGYHDVVELAGGMDAWRAAGFPLTRHR